MTIIQTFAAIGAFLLSAPVNGDRIEEIDGWSLYKNEDNCAIINSWSGDYMMRVALHEGPSTVYVSLTAPQFKSIENGKKYKIKLYFLKNSGLDGDWGEVNSTGSSGDIFNSIWLKLEAPDFLNDLSSSKTIAFMRDDRLVASLNLAGSSKAVMRLRACASQVEKENPSDPFAN